MCGYVQNGGESLLFLAVERCRGVERRRIVSRAERAETWRMAANRFFFDRINKINRIGVGVVYIL
jgi:hypothetical protein